MNINLDLLKTFKVVAKYENITRASEILSMSQPAVSKAIINLEEQLKCSLFTRSKKGVQLTNEGIKLYEASNKVLNIINDAIKEITKFKTINILVGKVLAEKILLPYITLFKERYPNIIINFSESSIEGVKEKIKNKEADIAIGYYIDDLNIEYNQIAMKKELTPILVCNDKYDELIQQKIEIKELEKYPFIISAKGATTHEYAKKIFKKYNLNIIPSMEVLGTSLITRFVKEGLGVSILTREFIEEELNKKELFEIKINQILEKRKLSIIYHNDTNLSEEIKYFIKILSHIDID